MVDQEAIVEDDEEIVVVEDEPVEAVEAADEPDGDEVEDEDEEEARLGDSQDDDEEDLLKRRKHERRVKRREMQRRARERSEIELANLRQINSELAQRVAAIEGVTVQAQEQELIRYYHSIEQQKKISDQIMARAIEAGNGEDSVAAQELGKRAEAELARVGAHLQQLHYQRQQAQQPQIPASAVNYASQWQEANPWYDVRGGDEESAIVNAIDAVLVREGYDPASRDYWEELTERVQSRIGGVDEASSAKPRRRAPPIGSSREHAPASTRKEVYVSPERKQAMIDAGSWHDPQKRAKMLKAYQAYDRSAR